MARLRRADRRLLPVLLGASAALAPPAAGAQESAARVATRAAALPQFVQELFVAETVQLQGRGETQVTLKARTRSREDPQTHSHLVVEYGITDRLQLSVRTPTFDRRPDDELRRVQPSVFVALLPGARPLALSARAGAGFARGVSPAWETGLVAARGFGRVQLHGAGSLERAGGDVSVSETLAALYDAGPLSPTVSLAHDVDGEARWALVPGLFAHATRSLEVGLGVPLALSGGRALTTARLVVTAEF